MNIKSLKQKKRDYYLKNKDSILIKAKIYRENNKDKIKAYLVKWRTKNREYAKEYSKKYGPRYYQKNKETLKENHKRWGRDNRAKRNNQRKICRQLNPELFKIRDALHNIKSRKGNPTYGLSKDHLIQIFNRDNVCVYCRYEKGLTLDHIIPLTKGGKTVYSNLVIACVSCNCSKNNRDVFEWCEWKGFEVPEIVKTLLGGKDEISVSLRA